MRKGIILSLLFVLFLIPVCLADDSWIYKSDRLLIELDISSNIKIVPESNGYFIDYIKADLSVFPENDFQQKMIKLEINPEAFKKEGILEFTWKEPDEKELSFSISSEIETENKLKKISRKVKFPLKNLSTEYKEYINPTEGIDIDDNIIRIASGLAEGEDDLYVIAHKIAEWVNKNIKYDMRYGSVTKKSSWILKNKIGTCDEFSSLFIALCRSLEIPVRYVSGIAYSNVPQIEGFGAHAWAEVYFPDYGWVPFDTTYGEFGFIDASHIKLRTSLDPYNSSTNYKWKGHDFDVVTDSLNINAKLKKTIGIKNPLIKIEANILKDSIGFGSYNLIEVTVDNPNNYYVPITLFLSVPSEIEIIDNNKKNILLMPNELKKVYWIIKLTGDLKRDYIYTLPIIVYNLENISTTSSFKSRFDDLMVSKAAIGEILEDKAEEKLKTYSRKLDLKCSSDKDNYYIDETTLVNCSVKNTGNILLDNVKICLNNDCKTISLGITQEKVVGFSKKHSESGKKEAIVKAKNSQVSKNSYVNYEVLDYPNIIITNLICPIEILFNKDYSISFMLNKSSSSIPKNIEISLLQNSFSEKWSLGELDANKVFNINLNSKTLHEGNNDFGIVVRYEDNNSRNYETKKDFSISVAKLSFSQKVISLLYSLELWLESFF